MASLMPLQKSIMPWKVGVEMGLQGGVGRVGFPPDSRGGKVWEQRREEVIGVQDLPGLQAVSTPASHPSQDREMGATPRGSRLSLWEDCPGICARHGRGWGPQMGSVSGEALGQLRCRDCEAMPTQAHRLTWPLSQTPPQIRPFRQDDFLCSLEHAGPQLTCILKGDWLGLYRWVDGR